MDLGALKEKLDVNKDDKVDLDDAKALAGKFGIDDVDDVKKMAKKAGIDDLGGHKDVAGKVSGLLGKKG